MLTTKMIQKRTTLLLLAIAALAGCGDSSRDDRAARTAVPVEVAVIERGSIRAIRTFSGALEASASFAISPKVAGRIERVLVDIGDSVQLGAVVAEMDAAEFEQELAQAEADLLVEQANLVEASSALEIAERALARTTTLSQRGVASDAELDEAKSLLLARASSVEVYKARVNRTQAAVESAKIRLDYTKVKALWSGDSSARLVAERYIDEGQTVAANTPLLRIVDVKLLSGVFFVTEKDYPNLSIGQTVDIYTDAYSSKKFQGRIARIAPVFQENSRQARVEIEVPNAANELKPGMFIRANVEVARVDDALIIPAVSILTRDDEQGIFLVDPATSRVAWRPVVIGIREGDRVQVTGDFSTGQVVTLGQHLIDDESQVTIVSNNSAEAATSIE